MRFKEKFAKQNFALAQILTLLAVLLISSCTQTVVDSSESQEVQDEFKLIEVKDRAGIAASEVLSFECELITQRPEVATPFCADFGVAIWDIKWSTWSAEGAEGTGIYKANDCDPDCASGNIFEEQVKLKMSGLHSDGSRFFLRYLNFRADSPLPLSNSKSGVWDVAEFYIESPWMR